MAIRLFSASSPLRGLFKTRPKINVNRNGSLRNGSMFPEPPVPWLESPSVLFSAEALKHNYGAIPMIVICLCGFTIDCILIARLALTRDDVYYTQNSAACEFIETRRGYKVPVRKLLVINQKYENPPGLLESIQGDVDGPPSELYFCFQFICFTFVDLEALKIRISIKNKNCKLMFTVLDCHPGDKCDQKEPTINGKLLAAHAAVGIGVMGLIVAL